MHLDQNLLPLLAVSSWYLAARAGEQATPARVFVWALAAGALLWVGLFVSFSLTPAIPMALAAFVAVDRAPWLARLARAGVATAAASMAFGFLQAAAHLSFHYDLMTRFSRGMRHHADWKRWSWSVHNVLQAAKIDSAEYVFLLGIPMAAAFLWAILSSLRDVRRAVAIDVFGLSAFAVLLGLLFFSKTRAEVGRLWSFLIQAVAIVAATGIERCFPTRWRRAVATYTYAQMAWLFLLKVTSDLQ